MAWEDFPSWFRRRRRYPSYPFFPESKSLEEMTDEMEKAMDEMFKEFSEMIPKNLIRERKLPGGRVIREGGPFVWGYSITIGPDGKPIIREFGNLKPSERARPWEPPVELREEMEPLVDVFDEDKTIKVVAELPGVEKEDIKLNATERELVISVDGKDRKYYKELELPAEINPSSAKSSYRNGVLEVVLEKKAPERKPKGTRIPVE